MVGIKEGCRDGGSTTTDREGQDAGGGAGSDWWSTDGSQVVILFSGTRTWVAKRPLKTSQFGQLLAFI